MTGRFARWIFVLLGTLVPAAGANDRRATARMNVSATVVSPCLINVEGQSNRPGCDEASQRVQVLAPKTPGAASRHHTSGADATSSPKASSDGSAAGRNALLIRF